MRVIDRFGYYLGGFSVGLIFLGFVFSAKKTSCNYSPSARVKNNLLQKKIVYLPNYNNKILINDSIVRSLINIGEINFSKSNTKKDSCRVYYIDLDSKNNFYLEIANCSKTIKIIDFKLQ
tara:strand:+ start:582 stop:941 length:360 start_codon:yes stop_codon:yes gene_type:complete